MSEQRDQLPDSPYGVICEDDCGKQGLTKADYDYRMDHPSRTWICPVCRGYAQWDDERYENTFYPEAQP